MFVASMTNLSLVAGAAAHRLRRSGLALIAVAAWLLAGCASLAPAPLVTAAGAPTYHETIDLGGRLSVRYQQNDRDEAVHGSFAWDQTPLRTELVLLSPLGQTLTRIEVTPAAATLTQAKQPPRVATDVDALARQALGWPLPVAGLRDWLQGFAVAADGQRQAVPRTPGATIYSDGWRIEYAGWQDDDGAAAAPRRIDLERQSPDASAGPISIRIVLDSWQPH